MTDQLGYEPPQKTLSALPSRLDIAVVGVRLLGIYALLQAILTARELVFAFNFGAGNMVMFAAMTPSAVGMAGGIILLIYAPTLGRRILPQLDANDDQAMHHSDLQSIAFAVVGLFLVVSALPMFLMTLAFGFNIPGYDPMERVWYQGIRSVVGVVLFLQAKGLSRLWHRLRTAGTTPQAADVDRRE